MPRPDQPAIWKNPTEFWAIMGWHGRQWAIKGLATLTRIPHPERMPNICGHWANLSAKRISQAAKAAWISIGFQMVNQ